MTKKEMCEANKRACLERLEATKEWQEADRLDAAAEVEAEAYNWSEARKLWTKSKALRKKAKERMQAE